MERKRKSCAANGVKLEPAVRQDNHWNDRELLSLATALQRYGFSETKKISELIRTKDENAVKHFIAGQVTKTRYKLARERNWPYGGGSFNNPLQSEIQDWPVVRKWRRVVQNQLLRCVRKQDYSKILMEDLFEAFYEEAEEPDNPQVVNVKAVYKYLLDCVRGSVPAELSPIDSGVVLMLLGQLKEMQNTHDFDEEMHFVKNFKRAKPFAPIRVKDEFRIRTKKRSEALRSAAMSTAENGSKGLENVTEASVSTADSGLDVFQNAAEASVSTADNGSETLQNTAKASNSTDNCELTDAKRNLCPDEEETIKVVEEMYVNLTKHRKIVQSFNPLNVPLWCLVKEQGYVQNKCETTPRPNF